jgi:hypothetical protein
MEAQSDMEGDPNNPSENAFLHFKNSKDNSVQQQIKIYTQNVKTSKETINAMKNAMQKDISLLELLKERIVTLTQLNDVGIQYIIDSFERKQEPIFKQCIPKTKDLKYWLQLQWNIIICSSYINL